MSGRVTIVGAGPGDPALLTVGGLQALRDADTILYDALVSDAVLSFAHSGCERIFVGKRAAAHAMEQRAIEALAVEKARAGKHVVRLKGGDPFVFGRGSEEAEALHAAGIEVTIVPGVTSAVAAAAYAGIPITDRRYASSFVVATGHEGDNATTALDWKTLSATQTLVVVMGVERLEAIAAHLVERGADAATPAAVVQNGTLPTQRCIVATLGTIAARARREQIAAPAILVVGSVVTLRERLQWFERRPLFGRRILVTRPLRAARIFGRAIAARGAEPVIAPAIAIGPPDDFAPARREIARLGEYAWVVFLSRNGVEAFFEELRANGKDARSMGTVRVAAIGPKSAQRLAEFGVRADLVSGRSTSEDAAADLLDRTKRGERILVVAAQEGLDIVRSLLADAGREPVSVAAYKTSVVEDPQYARSVARCDILTFASGSSVRAFATLLGGNDAAVKASLGKVVACIGPVTAGEARTIGVHVDVLPESFTTDALLLALEAHVRPA
ncbi:MAG: uroporphyrinogen-III C-methyltransferase [Candidatus Tyrphobacter sp.]